VRLSADGSRGPAGADLQYRWTQVSGPAAALDDAAAATPTFVVDQPGTARFELLVGDGAEWSTPADSWVVVIDPDLVNRHATGCGCASGAPLSGTSAVGVLMSILAYRRRSRS
jgi:hypothetical protein